MSHNNNKKTSSIPYKIISTLNKKSGIRFKEFKDMLNVSGQTLSINLKALLDEDTITFEKKGREKHYSLSKNAFKTWKRKIDIFSSNHNWYLEQKWSWPNPNERYSTISEAYEDIGKKIGMFYLYTLLKSLKTGKNWIDAVDSKEMFDDIAYVMLNFIFIDERSKKEINIDELLEPLDLGWEEFFTDTKKMINVKKTSKKLDLMFKELEKLYPQEFNAIKQSEKEEIPSA